MDLQEYERRRRVVNDAQEFFHPFVRERFLPVTIRELASDSTGNSLFTVTRRDGDKWSAEQWFDDYGGPTSTGPVLPSFSVALDWVWWASTRGYFSKFVVASELQADRTLLATWGRLAKSLPEVERKNYEERSQPAWADTCANRLLLGLAAGVYAKTPSSLSMRLARNPRTPRHALADLRRNPAVGVRWQLAGNPSTGARTLARLRRSADFGVRWYLSQRPETPTNDIVAWAREDSALWSAAINRSDVAPQDLDALDVASGGSLRLTIAKHPNASDALLSRFVTECDQDLGLVLLGLQRLRPAQRALVVERADGWSDYMLQRRLAGITLPLDVDLTSGASRSASTQQRMLAAASANTTTEVAALLAKDPSIGVRELLAASSVTPSEVISILSTDTFQSVREAVARNRRAPEPALAALADDLDRGVRAAVIANPSSSRETLQLLSDDPHEANARDARQKLDYRFGWESRFPPSG